MPLYDLPRIVIGLVIAIVFLVSVSIFLIRGEASPLSGASKQIVSSSFCNSDADCQEGVCIAGECACFLDSQCKTSKKCDMGIGLCSK